MTNNRVKSYAEGQGYIPKMLRKAITRQRMDASKRAEEDSILDLYDHALGNVGKALEAISKGATWDEASKAHGVNRRTLARAASVTKRGELSPPPHDPKTGEISSRVASGVEGCGPRPRQPEPAASLAGEAEAPAPITEYNAGLEQGASGTSLTPDDAPHEERQEPPSTPAVAAKVVAGSLFQRITGAFNDPTENVVAIDPKPMPKADTRTFDEIAGPLPDRLRRVSA